MTYGWAILIVVIVAGALYYLGVFNPSTFTGSRATGFSNLGLPSSGGWRLAAAAGADSFAINLKNNLPSVIAITPSALTVKVGDTSCTGVAVKGNGTTTQSVGIAESFNVTANCGAQSSGSAYTVTVTLPYQPAGGFNQTDTGTLTGTVA